MCWYCRARLLPGLDSGGWHRSTSNVGNEADVPGVARVKHGLRAALGAGRTGAMSTTAPTRSATPASGDPRDDARAAGLRYVSDDGPASARAGPARFAYRARGPPIRDRERARPHPRARDPARLEAGVDLPDPHGHIHATGRDARGRKQYRYHPAGARFATTTKFDRMLAFAGALPRSARAGARTSRCRGLPREKVLATVVVRSRRTLIRVGNEEYARTNGSFGPTTLRDDHVRVVRGALRLSFRGKSGEGSGGRDPRPAARARRAPLPGSVRASSSSSTRRRRARRARSTRPT